MGSGRSSSVFRRVGVHGLGLSSCELSYGAVAVPQIT